MSALLKKAESRQNQASSPQTSVWVAASAGTGKTKVLTDRLLKLLLEGTSPHRVLCLTFTNAAAAEMANRLHQRLSRWATLDDMTLSQEIQGLALQGDRSYQTKLLNRARTLFTTVLDASGGIKIQTIHSFCQALLKRFPLEAGTPPHFEVLDEQATKNLIRQAQNHVLSSCGEDSEMKRAFSVIAQNFEISSFSDILREFQSLRQSIAHQSPHISLGLPHDLTEEGLLKTACALSHEQENALNKAATLLLKGSKTDQQRGKIIRTWIEKKKDRKDLFPLYLKAFLTQEGNVLKTLATKSVLEESPFLLECLMEEATRVESITKTLKALKVADISAALEKVGLEVLKTYEQLKARDSYLDYDDLILKAGDLLSKPEVAPWVLYKLDGGLDHVLVDEAQDTSASQWMVIARLAEEFFHNASSNDRQRTLFVVGDVKQSIYSFQGADPKLFSQMKRRFGDLSQDNRKPWDVVGLDISFRSAQAVLTVVDRTFKKPSLKAALHHQEEDLRHHAFREGHSGLVELWPLERIEKSDEEENWRPPIDDYAPLDDPELQVAMRVADRIHNALKTKEILKSKGRPIKPSDFLILVQRRGTFASKLVRTLKDRDVPIGGMDRMRLKDQLVVKDLLALGDFLLLPQDDLTLAVLLKSPFCGLSEDDLYHLCIDRKGSLWSHLLASKKHLEIVEKLKRLLSLQDIVRPYELYMEALFALGGKKAFLKRLGYACLDPLEEFLNQLLLFERSHTPTLQKWIQATRTNESEIKRDFDQQNQDEVRIMTVHGSKGLQAPIVILPDAARTPRSSEDFLQDGPMRLWSPPLSLDTDLTRRLKERNTQARLEEYWRLLYVAMTRAEDHLYICGWESKKASSSSGTWYQAIQDALADLVAPTEDGVYRYETAQTASVKENKLLEQESRPMLSFVPPWLFHKTLAESNQRRWIQPSRLKEDGVEVVSSDRTKVWIDPTYAAKRGTLIHKILEKCPLKDLDSTRFIRSFLENPVYALTVAQKDEIQDHVLAVIQSETFQSLLTPHSYAEVPIIGMVDRDYVSGQIDRLIEREESILLVDYKTNHAPPVRIEEVPPIYVQQLKLYKELIQPLYPSKPVRTALFWTENIHLMSIS